MEKQNIMVKFQKPHAIHSVFAIDIIFNGKKVSNAENKIIYTAAGKKPLELKTQLSKKNRKKIIEVKIVAILQTAIFSIKINNKMRTKATYPYVKAASSQQNQIVKKITQFLPNVQQIFIYFYLLLFCFRDRKRLDY